jgi:hypothetical protein
VRGKWFELRVAGFPCIPRHCTVNFRHFSERDTPVHLPLTCQETETVPVQEPANGAGFGFACFL